MSCTPGYNKRERALLFALRHLMGKNHPLDPARCEGCMEIAAFLAIPGYESVDKQDVH
jgi:hypothetical protein